MLAGRRVVHVLRDLGHDLARQIGVDARNERGRHHEAGAQLERRARRFRLRIQLPAVALPTLAELRHAVAPAAAGRGLQELRRTARAHAAGGRGRAATDAHAANLRQARLIGGGRIVAALRVDLLLHRCDAVQHFIARLRRAGVGARATRRGAVATRSIHAHGGLGFHGLAEHLHLRHADALGLVVVHRLAGVARVRRRGRRRVRVGRPRDLQGSRGGAGRHVGHLERACRLDQAAGLVARDLLGEHRRAAGLLLRAIRRRVLLGRAIRRDQGHDQHERQQDAAEDVHGHVVDATDARLLGHFARRSVRCHLIGVFSHGVTPCAPSTRPARTCRFAPGTGG
ncbi:MAG: hypothetical protein GAK38_03221 [Xylophilus sp.]|nr:MAG: hypothetical protein GAK38_03221 [Xylophilus sp.]